VHINKNDAPATVETPGYTGKWAELGDMHYAFETCADGAPPQPPAAHR
jgi:hypothetical protein